MLKAAYKTSPNPDAATIAQLAQQAFGAATDGTIAEVTRFFRMRRMQEFSKREATLKRAVAPPKPSMVGDVEQMVLQCAQQKLGNGKMTNENLRYILGLVGFSTTGPKPELLYQVYEAKKKLMDFAEIQGPLHPAEPAEHSEEESNDGESESDEETICAKCHDGTETPDNLLFACAVCGVCWHQKCCAVPPSPAKVAWVCSACERMQMTSGTEYVPSDEGDQKRKQKRKRATVQENDAGEDAQPQGKLPQQRKRARLRDDDGAKRPKPPGKRPQKRSRAVVKSKAPPAAKRPHRAVGKKKPQQGNHSNATYNATATDTDSSSSSSSSNSTSSSGSSSCSDSSSN